MPRTSPQIDDACFQSAVLTRLLIEANVTRDMDKEWVATASDRAIDGALRAVADKLGFRVEKKPAVDFWQPETGAA